jgi:type 1 fimbria pilin
MFFGRLVLLMVAAVLVPTLCQASDGEIRFSGRVVESTCVVQTEKSDTSDSANLQTCSKHVVANTAVTTQVVTPNAYMVPWRANDTAKPDVPVTQWKVIQVIYL